ncbi:MAG: CPBP family intramembrane metalloprotease [Tannerellaceae bacterium]|jgi:membrane protease YdiL (CAAX protease family)|nr:CPBP family intramembrane metalloprotease [Tannerellaceae bacterium]
MKFLERSFDQMNQWWKYVIVCACSLLLWPAIGSIPLALTVFLRSYMGGGADGMDGLSKNQILTLVLFSTVVTLVLTVWIVKVLHRRSFAEVVNGGQKVRIGRCLTGAGVWLAAMSVVYAADYVVNTADYVLQFDPSRFIPLVFITLVFIPFQTTSEEYLFRGYLAQGLAAWTGRRWVALVVPSLIFGLMHAFNPEVSEFGFWATMPQYIYFGLFFGLVSILDDGIELSMGLHAANNIFLSLFATSKSSVLQTDAVLEVVNINPARDTALLIIMSLVVGAFFALRYKWNFSLLLKRL